MWKIILEFLAKLFTKKKNPELAEEVKRLKTSVNCIGLIKHYEGVRLQAYKCPADVWTIGYGDTGPDVVAGLRITLAEAEERLINRLAYEFEPGVIKLLEIEVTQGQLDALVSFAFNLGLGALKGSTLLKYVNASQFDRAADEFQRWKHAGGKVLKGLQRRRHAESLIFRGANDYQTAIQKAEAMFP